MKPLHILIALLFTTITAIAQKPIGGGSSGTDADKNEPTAKTEIKTSSVDSVYMVLYMPSYGGGSRGAGVAYDPINRYYYAVFAGNRAFPLAVFKANGDIVTDTLTAKFDVRGLWYNSKTKAIEGNAYNGGIYSYTRNGIGVPNGVKTINDDGDCQPDANSCGAYNPVTNEIIYYYEGKIYRYNRTNCNLESSIEIDVDPEYFNSTSVAYTGITGAEVALVDYDLGTIYFFDINTGKNTRQMDLPLTVYVEEMFNFSFANGIFWLFDIDARAWYGYKMK